MTKATGASKNDTRFKPGQSGNPAGRPHGARAKALVALDALAEGEAEGIVRTMIDKAKDGDVQAAAAILNRVWPARKGARPTFDLPAIDKAEDLPGAIASVTQQVASGDLSPDEAALIVGLLESQRKAIETADILERLERLEQAQSARS